MRRFRPTLVAGALALAFSAGTASAQFTNTYIFGDSLSDAGQYGSRFTTNPGLADADVRRPELRLHARRRRSPAALDYAQGGARVNSPSPPVAARRARLLGRAASRLSFSRRARSIRTRSTRSRAAPTTSSCSPTQFLAGQITQAQLQAGVAQAAPDLAAQVVRLRAAGAQYIILQNAARYRQDAARRSGSARRRTVHGAVRRCSTPRSTPRSRRRACRSSSSTRRRC